MYVSIGHRQFYSSSSSLSWYDRYLIGKATDGQKGWSRQQVERYDEFLSNYDTMCIIPAFGALGFTMISLFSGSMYLLLAAIWIAVATFCTVCVVMDRRYPQLSEHEAIISRLGNKLVPLDASHGALPALRHQYAKSREDFMQAVDEEDVLIDEYLRSTALISAALDEAPTAPNDEDRERIARLHHQLQQQAAQVSITLAQLRSVKAEDAAVHQRAKDEVEQATIAEQNTVTLGNWRGLSDIALVNPNHPRI